MNETENKGIETYPKESQESIARGLSQTETYYLGSFAQYIDDENEEDDKQNII